MLSLSTCVTLLVFLTLINKQPALAHSQQCSFVTIPVCDGDNGLSPDGVVNRVRQQQQGEMGERRNPRDFWKYKREINQRMQNIEQLLTPASCLTSSVYGRQTLRNNKEMFCDNGWTVIQRRFDGSVDFQLYWEDYKNGFGNLSTEFWIGLDAIHELSKGGGCRLHIDLWDFDDDYAFAEYRLFYVEDESDNYRLHIGKYSGTAGDSLTGPPSHQRANGMMFSTLDRDNDRNNDGKCTGPDANNSQGGWWYSACGYVALNAPIQRSTGAWRNVVWYDWKGNNVALKATTMKIRCD